LLSTKINYLYIKGHHFAVFHEVGVQIKESLGIIFRKCTEVEDAIEEEMTKAESLFMHRFTIQRVSDCNFAEICAFLRTFLAFSTHFPFTFLRLGALNWLKCTDDTNLFLEGVQMLVLQP
jgi:hypothetical protein